MGVKSDGRVDRRHVRGKTKVEVARKVRELENHRTAGTKSEAGRPPTLEVWLRRWLDTVAGPRIKPKSYASYESDLRTHLIPKLGGHRIDRLETEHIEAMFAAMTRAGSAPGTVHHVKRTLNAALNEAVARGMIGRNPATRASTPRANSPEIEPLTTDEAKTVLEAASREVNGAAWTLALCLGLRRGEVLALHWEDVDFERGTIAIKRSMGRLPWRHGCADVKRCAKPYHRPSCKTGCLQHAVHCPAKHGGGIIFDTPKSRAGRRVVTMPHTLIGALRAQKAQQAERQLAAGEDGEPFGLVFSDEHGYPVDPDAHSKAWKRLLARMRRTCRATPSTPATPPLRTCSSKASTRGRSWT